jgi:lipopolysaccharide/colanic/teichoic acid biosynthesis glycosyltransferase
MRSHTTGNTANSSGLHDAPQGVAGITGLAQVNGCRGETSQLEEMEARVNYDLDYLRRWTPLLDIKIILLTAVKVFRDDKAY